jgi:hypothetical protein
MLHCWDGSAKARPTFAELATALEAILSEVHSWTPPTNVREYLMVGSDAESDASTVIYKKGFAGLLRRMTGTGRPAAVNPIYDTGDEIPVAQTGKMQTLAASGNAELYDMGAADGDGYLETDDQGVAETEVRRAGTISSVDFGFGEEEDEAGRDYLEPARSPLRAEAGPYEDASMMPASSAYEEAKPVEAGLERMPLYEDVDEGEGGGRVTVRGEASPSGNQAQMYASDAGGAEQGTMYVKPIDQPAATQLLYELPETETQGEELYLNRDGDVPQFVVKGARVSAADIGKRVTVQGYSCVGTLQFVGPHKRKQGLRCGVALDKPVGKNNGTIEGDHYFTCQENHGVLVIPGKVDLAG